jgi:hypothetical protein
MTEKVDHAQRAAECLRKAEQTPNPDRKLAFLSSAQSWLNFAVKEQRSAKITERLAAKRQALPA